jgi:hypothetical protein
MRVPRATSASRGARNADIWRAAASGGGFSAPVDVTEIDTMFDEGNPTLSPDRLTLFWASNRTDGGAKGGYDIWTAKRADTSAPFSSIANVAELNTANDDFPGWLSPDGCRLYLTSQATVGQMYVATRPK